MRTVFVFVLIFLSLNAFGVEIHVAPLINIDEVSDIRIRDSIGAQTDFLNALWAVETGVVLKFEKLKNNKINPPQSLTDVATVCRNEEIEYLLYGYVTKRAHNVQMEIRLFDYNKRQVSKVFFGMDDSSNYERLINDIALKVLKYSSDVFHLEIKPQINKNTQLFLPISVGYWTPLEKEWVNVQKGTFTAASGLEFVPIDNLFVIKGKTFYFSTGLDIKYRLGVGDPQTYNAFNNTLYFTIPVKFNVWLTQQQGIFLSLGYVYFLEFFSMTEKYSDKKKYIYSNMGMNINVGYRFAFDNYFSLFFRNDFDFLINDKKLITYSPVLGLNFKFYSKEVIRKW